eukprot:scaffold10960_cov66-Phaeocystis_antarctica.AAC.9
MSSIVTSGPDFDNALNFGRAIWHERQQASQTCTRGGRGRGVGSEHTCRHRPESCHALVDDASAEILSVCLAPL